MVYITPAHIPVAKASVILPVGWGSTLFLWEGTTNYTYNPFTGKRAIVESIIQLSAYSKMLTIAAVECRNIAVIFPFSQFPFSQYNFYNSRSILLGWIIVFIIWPVIYWRDLPATKITPFTFIDQSICLICFWQSPECFAFTFTAFMTEPWTLMSINENIYMNGVDMY